LKLIQIKWDDEIGPILYLNINNRTFGFCFCHRRKDRTFWFFGLERVFCSRCLGIVVGGTVGILISLLGFRFDALLSLPLLVPLIIDGVSQASGKRESTNLIRFVTGFLFGFGLQSIVGTIVTLLR
jgi:uncharacterized membrane protein